VSGQDKNIFFDRMSMSAEHSILPHSENPVTMHPAQGQEIPLPVPTSVPEPITSPDPYNVELEQALSNLRQKEQEIVNLQAQKNSAQRQLTISAAAIDALNDDLTQSYNTRKILEAEIESNVRKITDLQDQIAQLVREVAMAQDQLRAQVETSTQQIELLNDERNHIKSLYDQAVHDHTLSNQTVITLRAINSESAAAFEAEKRVMQEHINELVQRYNEKSQIVAEIENSSAGKQYTVFVFVDAKSWNTDGILRTLSTTPDLRTVFLTNYKEKNLASAWVTYPDGSIVSLAGGRPLYLSSDGCMTVSMNTSKSPWTLVPQNNQQYLYRLKSHDCIKFLESDDGVKINFGGGIGEGFFMIPVGTVSTE